MRNEKGVGHGASAFVPTNYGVTSGAWGFPIVELISWQLAVPRQDLSTRSSTEAQTKSSGRVAQGKLAVFGISECGSRIEPLIDHQ
jgi:hypothetical protein